MHLQLLCTGMISWSFNLQLYANKWLGNSRLLCSTQCSLILWRNQVHVDEKVIAHRQFNQQPKVLHPLQCMQDTKGNKIGIYD